MSCPPPEGKQLTNRKPKTTLWSLQVKAQRFNQIITRYMKISQVTYSNLQIVGLESEQRKHKTTTDKINLMSSLKTRFLSSFFSRTLDPLLLRAKLRLCHGVAFI